MKVYINIYIYIRLQQEGTHQVNRSRLMLQKLHNTSIYVSPTSCSTDEIMYPYGRQNY